MRRKMREANIPLLPMALPLQLVVFLTQHDGSGSRGVILNRPASACVGDLLPYGFGEALVRARLFRPVAPGLPLSATNVVLDANALQHC